MSIFKRLSKKKSGDKTKIEDELVLDESISLIDEDESLAIPRNAQDAIPSLGSLTNEEQKIIQSILADKKTPRSAESESESKLDLPMPTSRSKKSVDEILNDDSYRSALSVLKGEPIEEIDNAEPQNSTEIDLLDEAENSQTETTTEEDDGATIDSEIERDVVMTSDQNSNDQDSEIFLEIDDDIREDEISTASETDLSAEQQAPRVGGRRITLTEMRSDVSQITNDIENGESLYRRAQQRVENLSRFIEKADVDFSLLDRLEPENKALKSENRALSSELEKRKDKISQLSASLEDIRRRYGDVQGELDSTQSKLAQSLKNLEIADRDIEQLNARAQDIRIKMDRTQNNLDVETRENASLRQKITDITEHLDRVRTEKLNHAKKAETLKIDLNDQTQNREKLRQEVTDLRHALDDAQRQNTTMRGEIGSVHEEIRSFKTQYEFNILKRDERVAELEAKVVELNDQVRLKTEIIESTTRDISILRKERTSQDLERERLEKTVKQQSFQLNSTEEELLKSKQATQALDQKYHDVAAALARESERRLASIPSQSPDILPRTDAPMAQPTVSASEATFEQIDSAPTAERIAPTPQIENEIEEMLTDYKLGLRSNIG